MGDTSSPPPEKYWRKGTALVSSRSVALALEITSDADRAAADVDGLTAAYKDLARAEEQAAKASKNVEDSNRSIADSSDELASKSSQATGALGALSSGFELVGAEKYAGALQGAALATDFMSGVGDSLNLVMELQAVQTARAKAAMVAHKAATIAQTVATKAQTVATKALNLVMRANPIGLIITAVLALIAGFVLLYKNSEKFRTIVQAVGRAGRAAIGWVVDRVRDLVGWVRDRLAAAFRVFRNVASAAARGVMAVLRNTVAVIRTVVTWVKDRLAGAFNAMRSVASTAVGAVSGAVRGVTGAVRTAVTWVRDKLAGAFTTMQTAVSPAIDLIKAPIDTVVSAVESLVNWIGKIKWPEPPGWMKSAGNFLGSVLGYESGGQMPSTGPTLVQTNPTTNNTTIINVTGTQLDPYATGRGIAKANRQYGLSVGTV